jgi:branched-chain amino acid transport system permease protein
MSPRPVRVAGAVGIGAAAAALAVYPLLSHNAYHQNVLLLAFLLAVMASSWNIISGYAGYVSLGHSVFLGIGAYAVAITGEHLTVSPFWLTPVGAVAAALSALVLGAVIMRTRGHSFVIITIAFLFLMQLVALNWSSLTGGSGGATLPLPRWSLDWVYTPFYYALLVLLALSMLLSWWIRRTKFGTGLIAIREDENKAAAIGITTPVYKVLAFVASAVLIGAAGGIYGYFLNFFEPRGMFNILTSVEIVLAVLLGGRATIWGPVLGAFALQGIKEATNVYLGGSEAHLVVFGVLMGLVVLFMPRGVLPTVSGWVERRQTAGVAVPSIEVRARPAPASLEARAATNGHGGGRRALLEVKGARKSFGGISAVDGCSLSVQEGTITALIGPNGSGKTTLFNLIDGTMRADAGEIWFDGRQIDGQRPWVRAHAGIGRTFQITRLFHQMTVLENVVAPLRSFSWRQLAADAVSGPEAARAEELLDFVGMGKFGGVRAAALSYGQQKLVELAQVLMLDPKLIMLDEPAGGINPTLIEHMAEMIRELNRQGKTFLIVEHNMPLVLGLCDPVLVLARGSCICSGTPSEVQADPRVLDAYLGEDFRLEQPAGVP